MKLKLSAVLFVCGLGAVFFAPIHADGFGYKNVSAQTKGGGGTKLTPCTLPGSSIQNTGVLVSYTLFNGPVPGQTTYRS